MTSKKSMLSLAVLVLALGALGGCGIGNWTNLNVSKWFERPVDPLVSPYATRHVWAIAPLRNDSGSQQADGLVLADQFQRQLENASNIDVLPVNRTLAAMDRLKIAAVDSPAQAMTLLRELGADGLVVGTITSYDPYDPPKLGLSVELYVNEKVDQLEALELRRLSQAATDPMPQLSPSKAPRQPVSIVSAVLDASDPRVRGALEKYGTQRGPQDEPEAWRRYRISMDLYSEFASYQISRLLLDAERRRLAPPPQQSGGTARADATKPTSP